MLITHYASLLQIYHRSEHDEQRDYNTYVATNDPTTKIQYLSIIRNQYIFHQQIYRTSQVQSDSLLEQLSILKLYLSKYPAEQNNNLEQELNFIILLFNHYNHGYYKNVDLNRISFYLGVSTKELINIINKLTNKSVKFVPNLSPLFHLSEDHPAKNKQLRINIGLWLHNNNLCFLNHISINTIWFHYFCEQLRLHDSQFDRRIGKPCFEEVLENNLQNSNIQSIANAEYLIGNKKGENLFEVDFIIENERNIVILELKKKGITYDSFHGEYDSIIADLCCSIIDSQIQASRLEDLLMKHDVVEIIYKDSDGLLKKKQLSRDGRNIQCLSIVLDESFGMLLDIQVIKNVCDWFATAGELQQSLPNKLRIGEINKKLQELQKYHKNKQPWSFKAMSFTQLVQLLLVQNKSKNKEFVFDFINFPFSSTQQDWWLDFYIKTNSLLARHNNPKINL